MNTEKVAFDIISLAGDAKAELQKALKLAREGNFAETQSLIDKASGQLQQAHKLQTQELLTREGKRARPAHNGQRRICRFQTAPLRALYRTSGCR